MTTTTPLLRQYTMGWGMVVVHVQTEMRFCSLTTTPPPSVHNGGVVVVNVQKASFQNMKPKVR